MNENYGPSEPLYDLQKTKIKYVKASYLPPSYTATKFRLHSLELAIS